LETKNVAPTAQIQEAKGEKKRLVSIGGLGALRTESRQRLQKKTGGKRIEWGKRHVGEERKWLDPLVPHYTTEKQRAKNFKSGETEGLGRSSEKVLDFDLYDSASGDVRNSGKEAFLKKGKNDKRRDEKS